MANTISLVGVQTLVAPETRALLLLNVTMNNQTYNWSIFMPAGQTYDAFLADQSASIYADIAQKEQTWQALTPKTKQIPSFDGGFIDVPIQKEEIVCPDNPDYYAKRRDAYPSVGDQLDVLWKGLSSSNLKTIPEIQTIITRVQDIKNKYPKPTI